MNKELEEAKKRIKILMNDDCTCEECIKDKEVYKTILKALESSIPKEVIKEKIELIEDTLDLSKENGKVAKYKITAMEYEIEDLKDLLEGK